MHGPVYLEQRGTHQINMYKKRARLLATESDGKLTFHAHHWARVGHLHTIQRKEWIGGLTRDELDQLVERYWRADARFPVLRHSE